MSCLFIFCLYKKKKQIGKPLLKNENFDIFRKKMKINKNQIRIMFLFKKTINIRNRKFKF